MQRFGCGPNSPPIPQPAPIHLPVLLRPALRFQLHLSPVGWLARPLPLPSAVPSMAPDNFGKKGLAERSRMCLALQLRLLSVLQLLAGAGYIVVAVLLQFPPGDSLTL